ncbi:MAG: flagellar basal body L-ring protein FlgH [Desulfovibrionaceae bacterium]|nr:flagellar basal body L-ring protein FlgH [Desulfovibrionaceae bacterium]
MSQQRTLVPAVALCAVLLLSACNGARKSPGIQPMVVPPQEYDEGLRVNNPGSIFANSDADPLFSDSRARRVGDIVVIKIVENSKSKSKADTSASKSSNNNYNVGALFGLNTAKMFPYIPGGIYGTNGRVGPEAVLDTTSASGLNATGETKRENYVVSSLAARVTRVMPGGLLQVEGRRETRVNEETQYMIITGTIRARDVAADNTIMSTQVADASIQYYGEGVLADKQRAGWFTRLMDNIWPF